MLGQVGPDGKVSPAELAAKVLPAFVVHGLLVVLHGAAVAKDGRAEWAGNELTVVRHLLVSGQAGPAGELRVAEVALEGLLRVVCLHVAVQGLFVLESGAALVAGERLGAGAVQALVNGQVVLAGEALAADGAGELKVGLVSALVTPQAVTPLEGLAAVGAHVLASSKMGVHV